MVDSELVNTLVNISANTLVSSLVSTFRLGPWETALATMVEFRLEYALLKRLALRYLVMVHALFTWCD